MPQPQLSDDGEDELVEPTCSPAAAAAGEEDSLGSTGWDFSRPCRAGSGSSGHFRPARHASLDAGDLQQRVYAAQQALARPGGHVVPAAGSTAGVFGSGAAGVRRDSHGASPNEGIEIAWVGFTLYQLIPVPRALRCWVAEPLSEAAPPPPATPPAQAGALLEV